MISKTEPVDNTKRPLHHPTLLTYTFHPPSLISFLHARETPNSLHSSTVSS